MVQIFCILLGIQLQLKHVENVIMEQMMVLVEVDRRLVQHFIHFTIFVSKPHFHFSNATQQLHFSNFIFSNDTVHFRDLHPCMATFFRYVFFTLLYSIPEAININDIDYSHTRYYYLQMFQCFVGYHLPV